MTASELVEHCEQGPDYQRWVNAFIDEFRDASNARRLALIAEAPRRAGRFAGLAAAAVDALCRETGVEVPAWAKTTRSPEPFFAIQARGYALRVRLMLESPPAFRARNVFVPENYLSRA
jgi:hypothetical protein